MKTSLLIDSYAWIEFFLGSSKGEQVRSFLDKGNCFTPLIVIAELAAKYAAFHSALWRERFQFIQEKTEILNLTVEIASEAGRVRQKMRETRPRFGLADAIIYETARQHQMSVLSGDPHFQGLPNATFLE